MGKDQASGVGNKQDSTNLKYMCVAVTSGPLSIVLTNVLPSGPDTREDAMQESTIESTMRGRVYALNKNATIRQVAWYRNNTGHRLCDKIDSALQFPAWTQSTTAADPCPQNARTKTIGSLNVLPRSLGLVASRDVDCLV